MKLDRQNLTINNNLTKLNLKNIAHISTELKSYLSAELKCTCPFQYKTIPITNTFI